MAILNAGRIVFDFAVNTGTFVQSFTEMGSQVATFVNQTTGRLGSTAAAFRGIDNTVFNSTKNIERLGRSIGGVPAELRKSLEWMYTYRATLDQMNQKLKVAERRYEELAAAKGKDDELTKHQATRVTQIREQIERANNSYEIQKERVEALRQRLENKAAAERAAAKAAGIHTDAVHGQISVFKPFNGHINLTVGALNRMGQVGNVALQSLGQQVQKTTQLFNVAFGTVIAGAFLGTATSIQGASQTALNAYMEFERLDMSLTQLVATEYRKADATLTMEQAIAKAADKSKELIEWTQQLAIQSPFSQSGIASAFQMSKAMGFTIDQAKHLTQTLTDWASASGKSEAEMQRIILALGQMKARGAVMGDELMQLTEAGLPVREILAKSFNVTTEELMKMQEKGLIPANDAIAAIVASLDQDFGGAAARSAGTFTGLANSMQDLVTVNLREFFKGTFIAIQPHLQKFVDTLGDPIVLQSIRALGEALGNSIATVVTFLSNTVIPGFIRVFMDIAPAIQATVAFIAELGREAYEWGYGLVSSYSDGIMSAANEVYAAVMEIANTITEWLIPHSPPKALPDIDKWGRDTMFVYLDAMGAASGRVKEAVVLPLSNRIATGMADVLDMLSEGDFSALDEVGSVIEQQLSSLVNIGALDEDTNIAEIVLGTRDQMAIAIAEFRNTGAIAESTYDRILRAAGPVGDTVAQYVKLLVEQHQASVEVEIAQKQLDETTNRYAGRLQLLNDRLQALQGNDQVAQIDDQIELIKRKLAAAAELPPGLGMDVEALNRDLEALEIQKEMGAIQAEQAKEEALAQEKLNVAQQKQQAQQENIATQKLLIEQIQRQMQLEMDARKQEEEGEESKLSAAEQYAYHIASESEKLQMLKDRQAKLTEGSDAWFALQTQIYDMEQQSLEQGGEQTKQLSKEELAAKRAADAQWEAAYETANHTERIALLNQKLAETEQGSQEYYQIQRQIRQEQRAAEEDQKRQIEQQWEDTFAMSERSKQVEMLTEKLAGLTPGTREYYTVEQQLKDLKDQVAAEAEAELQKKQQIKDAEWDMIFAGKERAGQIEMLREKLGGLSKESVEYYQVLSQLNALERAEAAEAERKAKAGSGGSGGSGTGKKKQKDLFDESSFGKMNTSMTKMVEETSKATQAISDFTTGIEDRMNKIGNAFMRVRESVTAFFTENKAAQLIVNALVLTLAQLAGSVLWGFLLNLLGLLNPVFMVLRALLTPMGLLQIAVAGLGVIWQNNFGGINQIVMGVWNTIQEPLGKLYEAIMIIYRAFEKGGIENGISWIITMIPMIVAHITDIGKTIAQGIMTWFASDDVQHLLDNLNTMFWSLVTWITTDGIPLFLRGLQLLGGLVMDVFQKVGPIIWNMLVSLFSGMGEASGGVLEGIGNFLKGVWDFIVIKAGEIASYLAEFFNNMFGGAHIGIGADSANAFMDYVTKMGDWLLDVGLPYLLEALVGLFDWIMKWVVGEGSVYLSFILQELISFIAQVLNRLIGWLVVKGIPDLFYLLLDAIMKMANSIGDAMPKVLSSLGVLIGRLIGELVTLIISAVGIIIAGLPIWFTVILDGILKLIVTVIANTGKSLLGVLGAIIGIIVGFVYEMIEAGRMLIEGLVQGLVWAWQSILDFFAEAGQQLIAFVKGIFGIESPSRIFSEIGMFLILGLLQGIQSLTETLFAIFEFIKTTATTIIQGMCDIILLAVNGWIIIITEVFNVFGIDITGIIDALKIGLIQIFTDLFTQAFAIWTNLKANLITLATDIFQGLVGAAGWFMTLKTMAMGIFTELVNLLTGNGGSFVVLKQRILDFGSEIFKGLVGATGWIMKIKQDAVTIVTDLLKGLVGETGLFTTLKTNVLTIFTNIWDSIAGQNGLFNRIRVDAISSMGGFVTELMNKFQFFSNWLGDSDGGFIKKIYEKAVVIGKTILISITDTLNDGLWKLQEWVTSAISGFLENLVSAVTGSPANDTPRVPQYALGSQFTRGGLSIVGEEGPELLFLPRGAEVKTASRTRSMFADLGASIEESLQAFTNDVVTFIGNGFSLIIDAMQDQAYARLASEQVTMPTVNTSITTIDNSRVEHHYHMTVNTRAEQPTVIRDFKTMKTIAGG